MIRKFLTSVWYWRPVHHRWLKHLQDKIYSPFKKQITCSDLSTNCDSLVLYTVLNYTSVLDYLKFHTDVLEGPPRCRFPYWIHWTKNRPCHFKTVGLPVLTHFTSINFGPQRRHCPARYRQSLVQVFVYSGKTWFDLTVLMISYKEFSWSYCHYHWHSPLCKLNCC